MIYLGLSNKSKAKKVDDRQDDDDDPVVLTTSGRVTA